MRHFIIGCHDLAGQLLSQYLLKVESRLSFISSTIEVVYDESVTYSVSFANPYPSTCEFTVFGSNKAMLFE